MTFGSSIHELNVKQMLEFKLNNQLNVGAHERDNQNRLPLHLACMHTAPIEVISALLAAHRDGEAA